MVKKVEQLNPELEPQHSEISLSIYEGDSSIISSKSSPSTLSINITYESSMTSTEPLDVHNNLKEASK